MTRRTDKLMRVGREWTRVTAAAAALVASLVLAGCTVGGAAPGVDRSDEDVITEGTTTEPRDRDRRTRPEARATRAPEVGDCRTRDVRALPHELEVLPDCTLPHRYETVHVGSFDDDPSTVGLALPADAAELESAARRSCADPFDTALWADWEASRLIMVVQLPSRDDWRAGARWYACDVAELALGGFATTGMEPDSPSGLAVVDGDVRSRVAADQAALRWCASSSASGDLELVLCSEPHNFEAIHPVIDMGTVFTQFPGDAALQQVGYPRCNDVAREFFGGSLADVSVPWYRPDERTWSLGHRAITCLVDSDQPLVGSLEDIGEAPLPFAEE